MLSEHDRSVLRPTTTAAVSRSSTYRRPPSSTSIVIVAGSCDTSTARILICPDPRASHHDPGLPRLVASVEQL